VQVSLRNATGPVEWLNIAKDGADLPPNRLRPTKAQLTITVGETYDVEFSSETAQDLLLDLLQPGQKIHTNQTLSFTPPVHSQKHRLVPVLVRQTDGRRRRNRIGFKPERVRGLPNLWGKATFAARKGDRSRAISTGHIMCSRHRRISSLTSSLNGSLITQLLTAFCDFQSGRQRNRFQGPERSGYSRGFASRLKQAFSVPGTNGKAHPSATKGQHKYFVAIASGFGAAVLSLTAAGRKDFAQSRRLATGDLVNLANPTTGTGKL
jgi:hypothetical protein